MDRGFAATLLEDGRLILGRSRHYRAFGTPSPRRRKRKSTILLPVDHTAQGKSLPRMARAKTDPFGGEMRWAPYVRKRPAGRYKAEFGFERTDIHGMAKKHDFGLVRDKDAETAARLLRKDFPDSAGVPSTVPQANPIGPRRAGRAEWSNSRLPASPCLGLNGDPAFQT